MSARISIAAIMLLAAAPALAADEPAAAAPPAYALGDLTKNAIASEAPAFDLLGVDPKDIQRPETVQAVGLAVLNGLDKEGKFKSGVALQFSPALLFHQTAFGPAEYRSDSGKQLLARFEITAAVAKGVGAGADKGIRATVGALWTPVDTGDPYASNGLVDCLRRKWEEYPTPLPGTGTIKPDAGGGGGTPMATTTTDPNEAVRIKEFENCRVEYLSRGRSTTIKFGLAPLLISESGSLSDLKAKGYAATAVWAYGLNRIFGVSPTSKFVSQIVAGVTYRRHEQIEDPTAAAGATNVPFVGRNRFSFGAKAVAGNSETALFSFEYLRQRATYEGAIGKDNYATYAVNADIKIKDDIWVSLTYGDSGGKNIGKSPQYVGSGLKFSFGKKKS